MTKQIPLFGKRSNNHFALVDDEDFEHLSQFKWSYSGRYATRASGKAGKVLYMHREILGDPDGYEIDHINHDTLDNRRLNLRLATRTQNSRNSRSRSPDKTSKYKGVIWHSQKSIWAAVIVVDRKQYWLGFFATQREAAIAYNEGAIRRFGEFACLNQIPDAPDLSDRPRPRQGKPRQGSQYKGVTRCPGSWSAMLIVSGRRHPLGYFPTPELAAKVYDAAVMKYVGPTGLFNFPESLHDLPDIDKPIILDAELCPKKNGRYLGIRHINSKWVMRICLPGGRITERYDTEIEAAKAYDRHAFTRGGKVIFLNFPADYQT